MLRRDCAGTPADGVVRDLATACAGGIASEPDESAPSTTMIASPFNAKLASSADAPQNRCLERLARSALREHSHGAVEAGLELRYDEPNIREISSPVIWRWFG